MASSILTSSLGTSDGLNETNFELLVFEQFVTRSAADPTTTVELVPGGRTRRVTWKDRTEWAALAQNYRIHEFDEVLSAVQQGIIGLSPLCFSSKLTWLNRAFRNNSFSFLARLVLDGT